ncbi:hypothetical protein [Bacillus sp. ISL-77]|nr:hypothetical protein [Bacillus sp. ISL-77]MBT2740730.1 hypothetical protein [Bacillus sp. ISL-77]
MAINALHKQEIEHEKFVNASYEAVKKEEEKVTHNMKKQLKNFKKNML